MNTVIKHLYLSVWGALALGGMTACSTDYEETVPQKKQAIEIVPSIKSIQGQTDGSPFKTDDVISLYSWLFYSKAVQTNSMVVNNARYRYDGQEWHTDDHAAWHGNYTEHYFLAVYPERAISDFVYDPYTATGDEDLMIAKNLVGVIGTDGSVTLPFKHVLAKIRVGVTFGNADYPVPPTIEKITIWAKHTAQLDYMQESFKFDEQNSSVTEVEAVKRGNNYEANIIPQEGAKIRFYVNELGIYEYTLGPDSPLEKGKITTLNFKMGADNATPVTASKPRMVSTLCSEWKVEPKLSNQ